MKRTVFLRRLGAVVSVAIAALLGGCVPSLHPLYTEADLVTEPAIVGTWEDENKDVWKFFPQPSKKAYTLVYTSGDDMPAAFDAHLTRIGQNLYMDTRPQPASWDPPKSDPFSNDLWGMHFAPMHLLWRVETKNGGLRLAMLDPERFGKALEEKTVSVAHERLEESGSISGDGTIVLTAPTPELREFVLRSADRVFSAEPCQLHRRPARPPAAPPDATKKSDHR